MTMLKLTKPWLSDAEAKAVQKVLDSGWLAEGKVTEQFEKRVAEYVGAKYAVAICNCTVALELCLKALNIQGEVVVPDFTHPGTAQAVINAGATPILHDVELESYTICGSSSIRYDAWIPVSWAGNPYWCAGIGSQIIEDAACSLGAEPKSGGDIPQCFSFHPRKLITTGEGGMVTTNQEDLAEKINNLKNFGDSGGNYKFDDVRAAIGLAQMDKLRTIIDKRIAMAKVYDDLLGNEPLVNIPHKVVGVKHTYQTYAVYIQTVNRNQIIKKLAEKDIETQIGSYALHLLPQFKNLTWAGDLKNAELLHHHLLALPMSYDITEEDQQRVVSELKCAL